MPTSDMRSTIDSRQFTLCPSFAAFASSMASTSTTGIVDAGAGVGAAAGAVDDPPAATPGKPARPAGGVGGALWWPKMLSFSLSKIPMGCLAVHGRQGPAVYHGSGGGRRRPRTLSPPGGADWPPANAVPAAGVHRQAELVSQSAKREHQPDLRSPVGGLRGQAKRVVELQKQVGTQEPLGFGDELHFVLFRLHAGEQPNRRRDPLQVLDRHLA